MSIYQKMASIGQKLFSKHILFKYGFNYSPMYKRSTGKIIEITKDLLHVKVKIPISWKNRNYVNSIFGGSLFSAVDPIPMIQLLYLIGDDYVVWDKAADIRFKKPAKQNVYADFRYTEEELQDIKNHIDTENEIEVKKTTEIKSEDGTTTFCVVHKTIYVANKEFYKQKMKNRKKQKA
ncbi:DUF4442 domain-containing protein [Cellulophaga lytica]|uniref:DUF4442 domain-containing protein n=1 Tax=Cellulophaga lytica TaxID=979 RepID=UPI000B7233C4|nr:DUF4442 domain-containing protein [Cellulophaga lytica]SNQ43282.1 Conserved hypothetical protein [Cellulophaga lytica]